MSLDAFDREHSPSRLILPVLFACTVGLVTIISLAMFTLGQVDRASRVHEVTLAQSMAESLRGEAPGIIAQKLQAAGFQDARYERFHSEDLSDHAIILLDGDGLRLGHIEFTPYRPGFVTFSNTMAYKALIFLTAMGFIAATLFRLWTKTRGIDLRRLQALAIAMTDPLSGLANRKRFLQSISEYFEISDNKSRPLVLVYIDLDGFKQINDSYGHAAGDLVIQSAADRLKHFVSPGDQVARLSGDEFAVIRSGIADANAALAFGAALVKLLSTPYNAGPGLVRVGASVGVAFVPDNCSLSELDLCRMADRALLAAKASGKNRAEIFTPDMIEPAASASDSGKRAA